MLNKGHCIRASDKTLHDRYIEYTLLYDMIANRISIDEVRAENGCLRLMKNLAWEYDITVKDELLTEALQELPERKRDIILLSYFLEYGDIEKAQLLNSARRTVNDLSHSE
ncbi:hypothetical protein CE91St63_06160 [[Clostridium] hylemonae]|mgnify:CR=1 FL=1|nr:hypothetical protein CE91St63_06160 [[Clostridium] hylemonae]